MQTAMSLALARAGLVSEEKAAQAKVILAHLKPYARQIQEIERLTELFTQSKVEFSILDLGATMVFQAMIKRGEYADAYDRLLSHMKKKAAEFGLS